MKTRHLLTGLVLITSAVIGGYRIWHTDQPAQVEASGAERIPQAAEEETTRTLPVVAENGDKAAKKVEQPPMIQYVGPIKPDTSVYGETADIYRTYDNETLEALAEGGDIMAIKVMAMRLTENPPILDAVNEEEIPQEIKLLEEHSQKEKRYFDLALIYGDTELSDSAIQLYGSGWRNPRNTPAETHNALLEKLAFIEFIKMRGDHSRKVMSASFIIDSFSRYMDEPVVLTEEDNTYIRNRAQSIYNELEAQREELGLGPFVDIEEYNSSFLDGIYDPIQEYLDAMGDNAF